MKSFAIFFATVAIASAFTVRAQGLGGLGGLGQSPGAPGAAGAAGAAGAPGAPGAPGAAGAAGAGAPAGPGFVDYGPKVYGMGAKNAFALPPNPFLIQRALAVANTVPNVLVRLDIDGEVTLTNQFGQEVDVVDAFGREIELEF